jgi:hypothetical protein
MRKHQLNVLLIPSHQPRMLAPTMRENLDFPLILIHQSRLLAQGERRQNLLLARIRHPRTSAQMKRQPNLLVAPTRSTTMPRDCTAYFARCGMTPKKMARARTSKRKYAQMLGILKQLSKPQINAQDKFYPNQTALHIAADRGLLKAAAALIRNGAPLSVVDGRGKQPLHYASGGGHIALVDLFLEKGANIHAVDKSRRFPLHWASERGQKEMVEHLLSKDPSSLEARSEFEWTPLHRASSAGHKETDRPRTTEIWLIAFWQR